MSEGGAFDDITGGTAGLAGLRALRHVVGGIGMWTGADQIQMGLYILQDVQRADLRREGATFVVREEQRKLRHDLLAELGADEVFPVGSVLLVGPDGRPDPRPVVAALTERDIVLLDADVEHAPEEELGRIPRKSVVGVRLLDEHGEPLDPGVLDERADLEAPPERRFVLWVDRSSPHGAGAHAFVFFAGSLAAEAARDLERAVIG